MTDPNAWHEHFNNDRATSQWEWRRTGICRRRRSIPFDETSDNEPLGDQRQSILLGKAADVKQLGRQPAIASAPADTSSPSPPVDHTRTLEARTKGPAWRLP